MQYALINLIYVCFAECNADRDEALQFRLDNDTLSYSHVTKAIFNVRVRCRKSKGESGRHNKRNANRVVNINLYHIRDGDTNETRTLISTHRVTVRRTDWQRLLVPTTLVEEVLASRDRTLRLLMKCEGCDRRVKLVMHHRSRSRGRRSRQENRPYLILKTAPPSSFLYRSRHRRRAVRSTSCCRTEEFVIDFTGLDSARFIVAPTQYVDKVCTSVCPGVCCEPVQRRSLSVIYVDNDDHVRSQVLHDFVTESCGCQN